ncbi:DUF4350 domain-containing protein [Natronorubrum tibetense]|uniref:DUF4350 domain-containing protein n=1 Tax=Natronorubrum tibetense GA33 TaxID=1114856 RepID=L9VKV1_9EURY|nr:DUF4350 domain-containing protein [Natronorubrum tibetense]ELY37696.1 hypothetical protein C496_19350 [Natronorubrum tibetense GA33]
MKPIAWLHDGGGIDWPRALLVALTLSVLVVVVAVGATSTAAFGPYNPSWDGTSDLRDEIDAEPGVESKLIRETDRYATGDPNGTVAFVIAPDEPYTGTDADRVQEFVDSGGTLVVLENFGPSGNDLLTEVNAEARVDGELLRDEEEYFRGPTMPVATGVENHTLTGDAEQLTLNYASAVEPGDATVLVRTSAYAYRDTNRDGELSDGEDLAAYPVATVEDVDDGQVVVVGDPSLAVNAMLDEPDNKAFLHGLYADADQVLIDLSHTEEVPPLVAAVLTLREIPLVQLLVGAVGIGAVAVGSRRDCGAMVGWIRTTTMRRLGRYTSGDEPSVKPILELDDEQRAAVLRRRHPEWDEQRLQRVIAALNRDGSKRADE